MDGHEEHSAGDAFNAGQAMNIHDGDALRLRFDDREERQLQVDAGDGHDVTARPPEGTVGADTWATRGPGGPAAAQSRGSDEGGFVGMDASGASGASDDWTEAPLRTPPETPRPAG